jgi:glycosyltransferase involved in cell wall biosynthesis
MHIALVAKPGHPDTGVGRYVCKLEEALKGLGHQVTLVYPVVPFPKFLIRWLKRWPGIDLEAFFNNYPVWARYPQADIYHLTSQNLATLLVFRPPTGKCVVTVHDLIPWLVRHDPELRIHKHRLAEWFDRLALSGLRGADGLLADSAFTKESLLRIDVALGGAVVVVMGVD